MATSKCRKCGKELYFKLGEPIKPFCSPQCPTKPKKHADIQASGPDMPPLKAEDITDEGDIALVKALVSHASRDVTNFRPGTRIRVEAEKFFESEYFFALTGLDGKAILRDLRNPDKKPIPSGYYRPVLCVETGVIYNSAKEAAHECNCCQESIWKVCNNKRQSAGGLHWRYAEGET